MNAIACILSYDGLSGVPPKSDSVDTLTTMVSETRIDKSVSGSRKGMGQNVRGPLTQFMNHGGYPTSMPPSKASASASKAKKNSGEPSSRYTSVASSAGSNPNQNPFFQGSGSSSEHLNSLKRHRGNLSG